MLLPGPSSVPSSSATLSFIANNSAILLIDAPDRRGLVATVSDFLYRHGANILHADQHNDTEAGLFFMRVEWALDGFDVAAFRFPRQFDPVAARSA